MNTPHDGIAMPGGSALPPGIVGFEPFLGPYGMSHVLAAEGIGSADAPLNGLPIPPAAGGRDFVGRAAAALLDLVAAHPVGHLLLPPDVVLLRAATAVALPVTVWLPPHASREVVEHFHRSAGAAVDIAAAPVLPNPRGTLPALVLLGAVGSGLCYLPPTSRMLLDLFASEQILGISALVDPTDAACGRLGQWLRWPSVWTSRFTASYRPADDEAVSTAARTKEP